MSKYICVLLRETDFPFSDSAVLCIRTSDRVRFRASSIAHKAWVHFIEIVSSRVGVSNYTLDDADATRNMSAPIIAQIAPATFMGLPPAPFLPLLVGWDGSWEVTIEGCMLPDACEDPTWKLRVKLNVSLVKGPGPQSEPVACDASELELKKTAHVAV